MNSEKLKPCPFCGGEAKVLGTKYEGGDYYIVCERCRVRVGSYSNPVEAIEAWNKRDYLTEEIQARLKKLGYYEEEAGGASVAYLLAENRDLRKALVALKNAKVNYSEKQNSSNLTYAGVEKMVKPLEWKYAEKRESLDVYKDWKSNLFFNFYQFDIRLSSDNFKALYLHDGHGHTIPLDAGREDIENYKHTAQKWLVDLVAAALGVERSEQ